MTTQPDLQARYLVSILDALADEASNSANLTRVRSLANNAANVARQLADTLGHREHFGHVATGTAGDNVVAFRRG